MMHAVNNKKHRVKSFLTDSRKGFAMVWHISKRVTLINLCLFVLQAFFPLFSLFVLKKLIDVTIANGTITWELCGSYLILFAVLQIISAIVTQLSSYYQLVQQQLVADEIAGQVLHKAIDLDLEYYENPGFYDDLHAAQQQSLHRPSQLVSSLQGIIQGIISIAMLSGFLMLVHWSVIFMVVILGVPMAVSKLLNSYRQYLQDKQYIPLQRKAFDYFQYLTTDAYAKEVRIFDFGKRFINKFLNIRHIIYRGKIDLQKKFLKQSLFIQSFEIITTTIIYATIILSAVTGLITIGGLVIYFQVFQRLQAAITSFFQSAVNLFQNQLYLQQIMQYLSAPHILNEAVDPRPFPALKHGVQVRELKFIYPGTETIVLENINMQFRPGEITAIAGENGSGKSTLIKLLCRLYNATGGEVLIDDLNIADIATPALRQNISAVFQDYGKYYMSIGDNIVLNEEQVDSQRLDEASRKAGLAEKVNKMPKGYKTTLGRTYKNGEQLSGGQWQKLALARGMYKQGKIWILDEPTSAMDPDAEYELFENLKADIDGRIIIVVTHRLYNLKISDNIYCMKNGSVVEEGSFDELVAKGGFFSKMYRKQVG